MLSKKNLWSCLRILIIFFVTLIALISTLYVYLLSASYSRNPIDANRFNINRQHLNKDLLIDEIAPLQVGEFIRKELTDSVSSSNYEREVVAVYENENRQRIDLFAYLDTNHANDQTFLSRKSGCGDCAAPTPVIHADANIPYGYSYCACWSFTHHQFRWINGDWQFSASAGSTLGGSNGETLLKFLNNYPF